MDICNTGSICLRVGYPDGLYGTPEPLVSDGTRFSSAVLQAVAPNYKKSSH